MKYFNENHEYTAPELIKFDCPVKIKLSELSKFLEQYKPFPCSDVWAIQRFEYGDYDNWVTAVLEDISVDATFSRVYREPSGIYQSGDTSWTICKHFWRFSEKNSFWERCPQRGYSGRTIRAKYIDEIEIEIDGVYVISWRDKERISKSSKN